MIDIECHESFCGVYATEPIAEGQVVHNLLPSEVCGEPTKTSIQIDEGVHIENEVGRYVNHSCHPTCEIKDAKIVSLKNIEQGQEITFDYGKNESVMAAPFTCSCCDKLITGKEKNERQI